MSLEGESCTIFNRCWFLHTPILQWDKDQAHISSKKRYWNSFWSQSQIPRAQNLGEGSQILENSLRRRSQWVDLSPARTPLPMPFSPIHREPLGSRSPRRNTWCGYGAHTSSWTKNKRIPYGFDFPVSHYFISVENRSTNESKFMKMFQLPAWILNRVWSELWTL